MHMRNEWVRLASKMGRHIVRYRFNRDGIADISLGPSCANSKEKPGR